MIEDNPDVLLYMPLFEQLAMRASFIIELGPGDGNGSLRAFTKGFRRFVDRQKLYICVELRDDRPKLMHRPTDPWFHLLHGDSISDEVVRKANKLAWTDPDYQAGRGPRLADLIFIDTAHTIEQLTAELARWRNFARRSTIWLFHDTWMNGEANPMSAAIEEHALRERLVFDNSRRECHGLGIMSTQEQIDSILDLERRATRRA